MTFDLHTLYYGDFRIEAYPKSFSGQILKLTFSLGFENFKQTILHLLQRSNTVYIY